MCICLHTYKKYFFTVLRAGSRRKSKWNRNGQHFSRNKKFPMLFSFSEQVKHIITLLCWIWKKSVSSSHFHFKVENMYGMILLLFFIKYGIFRVYFVKYEKNVFLRHRHPYKVYVKWRCWIFFLRVLVLSMHEYVCTYICKRLMDSLDFPISRCTFSSIF